MSENPAASDWATARGEKWRKQLSGMEAMLLPVDEPLIRALRLDAPYRIADIGCGGGGTTLARRGGRRRSRARLGCSCSHLRCSGRTAHAPRVAYMRCEVAMRVGTAP